MDVVLQGAVYPGTVETALCYLEEDFIDRVILSTWEGAELPPIGDPRIEVVTTAPPSWPGQGNVNYQVVSSAAGVAAVRTPIAAKMRSDQRISGASLRMMRDFVAATLPPEGPGPRGPLYVIGAYEHGSYPFHPQDHVFWGYREDLVALFDMPLSDAPLDDPLQPAHVDYAAVLRANLYIGACYHARHDARVRAMLDDPATWLLDGAPRREEACALSTAFGDRFFKVFPRVELTWEKRDWQTYPFGLGVVLNECWHEAPW